MEQRFCGRFNEHGDRVDWQGYEVDVAREHQCRARDGNFRRYCNRRKGHAGNHRAGATQWGNREGSTK